MAENKQQKGIAIAALVLGVIAIIGAFVPFLNVFSGILAVIAIILGIVGIVKKQGPMAIWGLVLAIVSFLIGFIANIIGAGAMIGAGLGAGYEKNMNAQGLDVTTFVLEASSSPAVVNGTLVNNTGVAISLPVVNFSMLDENGAKIGNDGCTAAALQTFAPGEAWAFAAECESGFTPVNVKLEMASFLDAEGDDGTVIEIDNGDFTDNAEVELTDTTVEVEEIE